MIDLIVFYLHTMGGVYAFTKYWQEEGVVGGILALGFFAIIFSAGWAISALIFSFIISADGFAIWLNRDTLSLLFLTVAEIFFYIFYLNEDD